MYNVEKAHQCEEAGCESAVMFDDQPFCDDHTNWTENPSGTYL